MFAGLADPPPQEGVPRDWRRTMTTVPYPHSAFDGTVCEPKVSLSLRNFPKNETKTLLLGLIFKSKYWN